jgi:GNAT superfamily N-acetyltransferase
VNLKINYFKKPEIKIEIFDCNSEKDKVWNIFKNHHYLTAKLNKSAHCYLACWNEIPVGFVSALAMPSGTVKNAWRGHRMVVLPDYQGLGIGNRLSEWMGDKLLSEGKRYFCKTANAKLGMYRDKSQKWKKTSKHKKKLYEKDIINDTKALFKKDLYLKRVCYAHEYIGNKA